MSELSRVDPTLVQLIKAEFAHERSVLDTVAAENIAPQAVLEAQRSLLTNKYADGYPGKYADGYPGKYADGYPGKYADGYPGFRPYDGDSDRTTDARLSMRLSCWQ